MKQLLHSAGVVILHKGEDGWRYFLLRTFHYWDFPKGIVEAGETPFSAAETSLECLSFPWGVEFLETSPYGKGKIAWYYIASSRTDDVSLSENRRLVIFAPFTW